MSGGNEGRALGLLAALIAAAIAVVTIIPRAAQASSQAGSGVLLPWALENENPNPGQVPLPLSQALRDAANFNFITAHPIDYQGEVSQMKQVNSRLIVLAYQNATFAQVGEANLYPSNYYEYDASGNKVRNPATGNYLMDPANPGWVYQRQIQCRNFLAASGYDGCYLDLLGLAPLSTSFVSGVPIDPRTNKPWTKGDWLKATSGLAASVRTFVHPHLLFGNGLSDGQLFFDRSTPTSQLVTGMDGGVAEAWLRGSHTPEGAYPSESAWKLDVNMLIYVEKQGKPLLTLTKLWVNATSAEQQSWIQYSLASFLMGTQGRSAFFFSPGFGVSRTTPCQWCNTNLGTPVNQYAKVANVYQRSFSNGRVLVNPSRSTIKVNLGGTYYTLARQAVTSVTMTPNTGVVLTKS